MRVLIIPAAGSGTRLAAPCPKALFPVAGRPMVDHLLDLYGPVIDLAILVLSAQAVGAVREHCAARTAPSLEYAVQEEPTGMLDAVLVPRRRVEELQPQAVWITWCDQVAIHPCTVELLAEASLRHPATALALPTVCRRRPYIHLVRGPDGRIVDVLHQREGDAMPAQGESDVGLFSLSLQAYARDLPAYLGSREAERGAHTGEQNFLPFIAWLGRRQAVVTFPCRGGEIESVGVNDRDDLRRVEEYLTRGR